MHPQAPAHPVLKAIAGWPRWAHGLGAAFAGAFSATGFAPTETVAAPIVGVAALLLLLAARPNGFLTGFLFGWAHFGVGLTWIATAFTYQAAMPPVMGWVAVVGLAAFLALYPAAAAYAARRLTAQIVPLALLFAGLFMLTEMLRGILFGGFPWNPLGAPWLQLPGVAALAAFVGSIGLSGLIILSAGGLAALLAGRGQAARWALVAVFPLLLGVQAIPRPAPTPVSGPTLLLVQPNIRQSEKQAPGGIQRSIEQLIALTGQGFAAHPQAAAAIWPEAAIEYPLEDDADLRRAVSEFLPPKALLLSGGVALERDAGGQVTGARNSLYALDSSGAILARFDKARLVPGGEFLPLRWLAEPLGLSRVVPGSLDFLPGPGPQTLHLPGLPPLGPAICYEIIFPGEVVDAADRPGWIITISNDAWFGPTGPPQHHAQARLRAIEEGLPVVRVTPTGITSLIGPRGAVVQQLPAHKAAVLAVALPAPLPSTVFARLGLAAPGLLALLLVALGLLVHRKKT